MCIAGQVPCWIEFYPDIGQAGFVKDTAPQSFFHGRGFAELRHDNERLRAPCACQADESAQTVTGLHDALLDGSRATVGNEPVQQRGKPPILLWRLPNQS